jgi:hypothetical protein
MAVLVALAFPAAIFLPRRWADLAMLLVFGAWLLV